MLAVKIIENNTMYSVQEQQLCIFSTELHSMELPSVKAISVIFTSSIFSVDSSINLSTNFFLHLQFSQSEYSPTSQIYHIHTHSYQDSKQILCHIHLYQLILCIHTCIYHHSNVVYYYKRLHIINIYTYTFHAILVLDIKLNTLTFMFFIISGTHIFAYASLILLQVPLIQAF